MDHATWILNAADAKICAVVDGRLIENDLNWNLIKSSISC
jgi:hypothetical protein